MKSHHYFVYMLTNKHKNVLYTGITNDLIRRLSEHQEGIVSGFTKKYNCFYLVYFEYFQDVFQAINREKQIKGWRRAKKNALIVTKNPDWKFLNEEVYNQGI